MSLIPLPKVRCGSPKMRKYPIDVPGTANISYGHKLRERENCQVAKYHSKSIFVGSEKDKREYEQFLKTVEFEKETDRKIKNKNLHRRVQQDVSTYEENLQKRREKLRSLVSSEEMNLTREIAEEARRGEDARLEGVRARTEEQRKRREEERETMVAAKRMQQYLATCPDVKRELWRRRAIDAKRCNVAQMADNEARRLAEKELDDSWHEVMLKELAAKKREETEESEKRALAQRETALVLSEQMENKLALEEERKRVVEDERERLERLWEDVRRAELQNLQAERQKRERLRGDLEEHVLTANKFLVERAREEAAVDRAFKGLAAEELAKEGASASKKNTAALRAELLAYLKHLEDLRREEAKRNLEVEATVEQSRKDVEARRELAQKKFKEARERVAREILRGREEQLRAKREAEEQEQRFRMKEREALERQIEMDANLSAMERKEGRQRAFRYGLELKEQQRRVRATRRRELEEDRKYHREEAARQADEYQKLTDELLKASENITPHPFKVLLKECAARHTPERGGRHYCPPALTFATDAQT